MYFYNYNCIQSFLKELLSGGHLEFNVHICKGNSFHIPLNSLRNSLGIPVQLGGLLFCVEHVNGLLVEHEREQQSFQFGCVFVSSVSCCIGDAAYRFVQQFIEFREIQRPVRILVFALLQGISSTVRPCCRISSVFPTSCRTTDRTRGRVLYSSRRRCGR